MKLYKKGKPFQNRVPESFRVLVKELQSLGLDMRVADEDDQKWNFVTDEGMDEDIIHVDDLEKPAKKRPKRLKAAEVRKKLKKQQKRKQQKKLLNRIAVHLE